MFNQFNGKISEKKLIEFKEFFAQFSVEYMNYEIVDGGIKFTNKDDTNYYKLANLFANKLLPILKDKDKIDDFRLFMSVMVGDCCCANKLIDELINNVDIFEKNYNRINFSYATSI